MIIVALLLLVLLVCFGAVLLVGAPYLPTLTPQVDAALGLANLQPGDILLELGSGDGKVLVAAARRGIVVVGYELNPLLVAISWLRTRRYRDTVSIIWGDFWHKPWPEADAIFAFLLPRYIEKLDNKVMQYPHKPVKLLSFAFAIPARKASDKRAGVYLYAYK